MIQLNTATEELLNQAMHESGSKDLDSFLTRVLQNDIVDMHDLRDAEAAYNEFIDSGLPAIPFDKVMLDNGL